MQPGHATHAAQEVVLLPVAVQICTPGVVPLTMHKRTSCCMHGQLALMLSFQAQTRGLVVKQVELAY